LLPEPLIRLVEELQRLRGPVAVERRALDLGVGVHRE